MNDNNKNWWREFILNNKMMMIKFDLFWIYFQNI